MTSAFVKWLPLRWKLEAARWLLWSADAVICSLPTPDEPRGDYFDQWAALGNVHSEINRAYWEVPKP